MVLVAEAQQLKAKLMLNGRPEKMVRKKMLDGAGMIAKVPQRRKNAADIVYCEAIGIPTRQTFVTRQILMFVGVFCPGLGLAGVGRGW